MGQAPAWREVFGLQSNESLRSRTVIVAVLGMGVPAMLGLASNNAHTGILIGLGAILLAGSPSSSSTSGERPSLVGLALLLSLAVASATLIDGTSVGEWLLVATAALAAILSGYSRPAAVSSIRFIIYLVLCLSLLKGSNGDAHKAAPVIFALGALWNIMLRMMLVGGAREPSDAPQKNNISASARRRYFVRSLAVPEGWQFALRLSVGFASAVAVRHLWPSHHSFWIVVTVALLTERNIEQFPVKTVQRLIGTVAGVTLTWLIFTYAGSSAGLAVTACVLSMLVPISRSRSYLLYSVFVTPLILIVLDFGLPPSADLLLDRLFSTIVGAAIVLVLNALLPPLIKRVPRSRPVTRSDPS